MTSSNININPDKNKKECPPGEICITKDDTVYITEIGSQVSQYIRVTIISLILGSFSWAISWNIYQIILYLVTLNMPTTVDIFWVYIFSLIILIVIFSIVIICIWLWNQFSAPNVKRIRIAKK